MIIYRLTDLFGHRYDRWFSPHKNDRLFVFEVYSFGYQMSEVFFSTVIDVINRWTVDASRLHEWWNERRRFVSDNVNSADRFRWTFVENFDETFLWRREFWDFQLVGFLIDSNDVGRQRFPLFVDLLSSDRFVEHRTEKNKSNFVRRRTKIGFGLDSLVDLVEVFSFDRLENFVANSEIGLEKISNIRNVSVSGDLKKTVLRDSVEHDDDATDAAENERADDERETENCARRIVPVSTIRFSFVRLVNDGDIFFGRLSCRRCELEIVFVVDLGKQKCRLLFAPQVLHQS